MTPRFRPTTIVLAAVLTAALALPGGALAEYYVPPGNSAANQYTETIPSAGGDSGGRKKKDVTPATALGAENAKKLENKGETGKAAAQLAAETAPTTTVPVTETGSTGGGSNGGGHPSKGQNGGDASGSNGGGGISDTATVHVDQPSGSSGIGSVLGQATGSADDGSLGLWLPLVILAALAGSIAYAARQRHGRTV